MFTPLHRALGRRPGDLVWDMFSDAVAEKVRESADLDWKRQSWSLRDSEGQEECAKDLAAMANSGGGMIVLGVADVADAASQLQPLAADTVRSLSQQVRNVAYTKVSPPLVGLQVEPVANPDAGEECLVAVIVPESPEAPHLASAGNGRYLCAPYRTGADTAFMTERELERAYSQRFTRRRAWDEDLDRVFTDLGATADASAATFVAVVRPHQTHHSSHRLTQTEAHDILLSARSERTNLSQSRYSFDVCFPDQMTRWIPGLRRWNATDHAQPMDAGRQDWTQISLHFDGTVAIRTLIHHPDDTSQVAGNMVENAVLDLLAITRAHAQFLTLPGLFTTRVQVVGPPTMAIYGADPVGGLAEAVVDPVVIAPVDTEILPLSATEVLLESAQQIALDLLNQAGIRHLGVLTPADSSSTK